MSHFPEFTWPTLILTMLAAPLIITVTRRLLYRPPTVAKAPALTTAAATATATATATSSFSSATRSPSSSSSSSASTLNSATASPQGKQSQPAEKKQDLVAEVYAQVGQAAIEKMVADFYVGVEADPIIGPLYSKAMKERGEPDLAGAKLRLTEYLVGRFGGPPVYVEKYGHPRLRARHFPFVVTQEGRDHWVVIMEKAVKDRAFPAPVEATLLEFFSGLSVHMINTPN